MNAPTLPDWLTTAVPTLALSIIPDVSGQSIQSQRMPWSELANMIANPATYPDKFACPLIKLATFGTTRTAAESLRHDGNVLTVTGIEGDYDDEQVPMSVAVERARAAGIAAVFYTSARHTPNKPRWRVVCPLSAPAAPDKREGLLACVDALLGNILASESYTLSQTYFYGRVDGAPFESVVVDGAPFDTVLPAAERARRQTKAKGPTTTLPLPDDFAEVLAKVDPKGDYTGVWMPTVLGALNTFGEAAIPGLVEWSLPWYQAKHPQRTAEVVQEIAAHDIGKRLQSEGTATWGSVRERAGLPRVDVLPAWGNIPAPAAGATDVIEWPDPQPIPDVLLPVPAFDYSLLPDDLVDLVRDSAERMQCPPDYIAVVAMTALGALIARKRVIRPKKNDTGWVVLSNLWCAIIGRSAMMKSPALKTALKFLRAIAAAEKRKHAKAVREWLDNQKFADMEAAAMDAEARKLLKEGKRDEAKAKSDEAEAFRREHAEPVEKRYETNDATPEVLHQLYAQNPQGIVNIVDELARWLRDMDKQGREGSRQFHIESWDGDIPYTMDRIGRGKNMQATMCETVIGGMQPARLHPHVKAANSGTGDDDGLIQRFSMMIWPDSEPFTFVDRAPDARAEASARLLFGRFDDMPILFDDDGQLKPVVVGFTEAAQTEFVDWYCRHVNECRSGDLAPALVSHLLKYSKAIPALALIIGTANGEAEISTASWRKAMGWYRYLRAHAERIYDYASSMLDEIARSVLKKITDPDPVKRLGRQVEGGVIFSVRDAMRKVKALEDSADLARNVLDFMADLGYLRDVSGKDVGKDTFAVSQKVFDNNIV